MVVRNCPLKLVRYNNVKDYIHLNKDCRNKTQKTIDGDEERKEKLGNGNQLNDFIRYKRWI